MLRGVPPPASRLSPAGARLWPWLALLALLILALDWALYGRGVSAAATFSAPDAPLTGGSLGLDREPAERLRPEQVRR